MEPSFAYVSIVWAFYPETKGLTLEGIDTLFIRDHGSIQHLTDKGDTIRVLEDKPVLSSEATDMEKR